MKTKLKIVFCNYNKSPCFTEFLLNNESFDIKNIKRELELEIPFNNYEQHLCKKVCEYKLFTDKRQFQFGGLFEIYNGDNIGFCFIDNVGTTFEMMFLQKIEQIEDFIKDKYTSSILDSHNSNVEIDLCLNQNKTKDRANLILINCLPNTFIKQNGKIILDIEKIKTNIDSFSFYDSYQLCFYSDSYNYNNFTYKKITPIEKLNFNYSYDNHNKKVDEIYNKLLNSIKANDLKFRDILSENQKYIYKLDKILKIKYSLGNKILEEELNKEYYIDFIFKILFIISIEEYFQDFRSCHEMNLEQIYNKLNEDKILIYNDNLLKIYEKIIVLINSYYLNKLRRGNYTLKYCLISNAEKNSPLFNSNEFINNFIDELDNDSNFYYPSLLFDNDNYSYKYIKNEYRIILESFGFSILSLEEIKYRLKNMIPNIIIFSSHLNNDDDSIASELTGNIILNLNRFKGRNILKDNLTGYNSNYNFIVLRTLMNEIFKSNKTNFCKYGINCHPIISLINENDILNLSKGSEKDLPVVKKMNENKYKLIDDTEYLFEYLLGKLGNENILFLINFIEYKYDLSKLLVPELWHKDLKIIKEYIKLMIIVLDNNNIYSKNNIKINNELDIKSQIDDIKLQIVKNKMKIDNKNNIFKKSIECEINQIIDEKFNESIENLKKRDKLQGKSSSILTRKNIMKKLMLKSKEEP